MTKSKNYKQITTIRNGLTSASVLHLQKKPNPKRKDVIMTKSKNYKQITTIGMASSSVMHLYRTNLIPKERTY